MYTTQQHHIPIKYVSYFLTLSFSYIHLKGEKKEEEERNGRTKKQQLEGGVGRHERYLQKGFR